MRVGEEKDRATRRIQASAAELEKRYKEEKRSSQSELNALQEQVAALEQTNAMLQQQAANEISQKHAELAEMQS